MNIFSLVYLVNVFWRIKTEYKTIKLKFEDNNFYIPIQLSNNQYEEYFLFSTMLPVHFFPSSECTKCKNYHIDEKDKDKYTFLQANVSLLYYYLNFSGDLYRTNITLGSEMGSADFIAVNQIFDIDEYNGKGRYSLSFLNYNYNTSNKTFAIYLNSELSELHLGGYNEDIIEQEDNLRIFKISRMNNSLPNLFNDFWFINFDYFYIDNNKLKNENFKITFDLNTAYFHIPKDFFFSYAHLIFPEEGKCQVQPEGHFVCFCNEKYNEKFAKFQFMNGKNETIEIMPEDYIMFDNSGADNYCYVYLLLNYENDLFIAGKYIMSNYYNIFDMNENQLKLYPIKKNHYEFYKERNIIISIVLLLSGLFLFLFCYLIYRKYFSNNQVRDEDEDDYENFFQENNNEDDINIHNFEQIIANNNENVGNNENSDNLHNNDNNDYIDDIGNNENGDENNINNNDDNEIVFGGRESNIIN